MIKYLVGERNPDVECYLGGNYIVIPELNTEILYDIIKAQSNEYILFLSSNTVSKYTPKEFQNLLNYVETSQSFEIFYFYRYSDNRFSNTEYIDFSEFKISNTYNPHGVEAFLLSPSGCNKLLSSIIQQSKSPLSVWFNHVVSNLHFKARCCTPVFFSLQKVRCPIQNQTFLDIPNPNKVENRTNTDMSVFWFIMIVIIVFLIGWGLTLLFPNVFGETYCCEGRSVIIRTK